MLSYPQLRSFRGTHATYHLVAHLRDEINVEFRIYRKDTKMICKKRSTPEAETRAVPAVRMFVSCFSFLSIRVIAPTARSPTGRRTHAGVEKEANTPIKRNTCDEKHLRASFILGSAAKLDEFEL